MTIAPKKNNLRMFFVLLLAYLVVLHVLIAVLLIKSDFISRVSLKLGALPAEITPHYRQMLAFQLRQDANIPAGAVIFIGDSLTQGLAVSAVTNLGVNYGIGADTTHGVLARLPFYRSLDRAGAIVLAIGINDLKRRTNEDIIENYQGVLDALPTGVPVIVNAILPIDEQFPRLNTSNLRIAQLNSALRKIVEGKTGVDFLDISSSLVNERGNLNKHYHIGDGIHLSPAGYRVWIKALRAQLNRYSQKVIESQL